MRDHKNIIISGTDLCNGLENMSDAEAAELLNLPLIKDSEGFDECPIPEGWWLVGNTRADDIVFFDGEERYEHLADKLSDVSSDYDDCFVWRNAYTLGELRQHGLIGTADTR